MARRGKKKRKTTTSGIPQRHPSGRLYEPGPKERKEESERDAMATVIEARQRVFGVSEDDAKKFEAGSVIGRLHLTQEISAAQLEAASRYETVVRLANAAILVKPLSSPGDLNRSRGHDASDGTDPDYIEKCRAAEKQATACWRALRESHPLARWAVDTIVVDNQLVPAIGELRVGLNVLCRVFRIPTQWAA